jgi:RNA 2',3'-cyclic 3'-phosphodiesterase
MRLFVAVNLPEPVRSGLYQATEPLRRRGLPVKWVKADGIHLTLKFLGEVDPAQAPDIGQALDRAVAGTRTFSVGVSGFGVFPDYRGPRVLWAGVEPHPSLELLQDAVERAMVPLGFEPEGRAFRPHLTLGRAERDAKAGDWRGLEEMITGLSFEDAVTVESLDLMESKLQASGAVYSRRTAHRLVA